ncbi:MAG: BON domain-containing protein [Acidobacteria bacterium]|nr:MAG: BON domain-containing protein [Acidobacteriota bacterium]
MRTLVRLIAVAALSLGIGLGAAACDHRSTATNDTGDRVEKALEQANLRDVNVDFDKDANVVHLKGKVNSADQKQQAERIAETAVGTSGKVLNELTVAGMDEDRVETADDQIKNRLTDAVNTNERLADQSIDFYVNNGVVTVTGEVETQAQKDQISQLVKGTPGVKDFANELTISKGKTARKPSRR